MDNKLNVFYTFKIILTCLFILNQTKYRTTSTKTINHNSERTISLTIAIFNFFNRFFCCINFHFFLLTPPGTGFCSMIPNYYYSVNLKYFFLFSLYKDSDLLLSLEIENTSEYLSHKKPYPPLRIEYRHGYFLD